jgi:hypothetical protein
MKARGAGADRVWLDRCRKGNKADKQTNQKQNKKVNRNSPVSWAKQGIGCLSDGPSLEVHG